ncbi:hypothetical protein [Microbacterium maritypicum]|uniref:hypothetical protein n=1 Tax=Microbacterium maritypicum TaxID=33918 RepID=UPI00296F02CF|nr:hypothetical protein [Microbacterium liquefaciens]
MARTASPQRPTKVGRRVAAAVGIVASAVSIAACAGSDDARPDVSAPSAPPRVEGDTVTTDTYRDGEYSARGWYGSLPSHHDVTLTIENGIVTDVDITTPADHEISLGYQQRFADALPREVVGTPLDDIVVDRLAGSSGCSEGFMNALADMRENALR